MTAYQRIQLDEARTGSVRFLAGLHVSLEEGKSSSIITILRTGSFNHPIYGRFEVSKQLLEGMVRNFNARTYGQDIFIDVGHKPQEGAAGEIKKLFVEGNRLRALVEWTDYGIEAIKKRGFRYLSADYADNWKDNEAGDEHGPVLFGAGLVTRPHVKRMEPIQLAESDDGVPTLLHPELSRTLLQEAQQKMNEYLKKLRAFLASKKLGEAAMQKLLNAFETSAKALGEDTESLEKLLAEFQNAGEEIAKALADGHTGDLKIEIKTPQAGKTLSEDDIKRILVEQRAADAASAKQLEDKRTANVKIFTDAINGQEGFDDDLKKQLSEGCEDLITPEMTEDQVKKFAQHQVDIGNKMVASRKLAERGFHVPGASGSMHISVDDSNAVKKLQETVDRRLGYLDMSDSKRFAATDGKLQDENKAFAEKVLAQYDADHAVELREESKRLSGGDGVVSDVAVPVSWERTVIREALYQMVGLQFVDVGTVLFGSSYSIPYSYRDTTGAGRNDTRVYEGGSIKRAGVIQTAETAYNLPQKISFEVSDELRYLTQAGHINYEAVAENTRNASRIVGEDSEQVIFNEVMRASDEYGAAAVVAEDLELQADDTKTIFVLAHFPVVHPRAVYDLQGNQVGSTTNPITVTYNATALAEYDGTGTQAAGTYYVLDYNQGEIYLVDESGSVQTPANGTAYTISYSYATNVYAFDTDLGTDEADVHWDGFLYRYNLRKAIIEDDRYHMANFGLMSGSVMAQVERAKQFGANSARPGTDLSMNGNLGRVKDVPNFKARAPGLWMGDQRVIIGERGQTRFRMAKPWQLGELENQKDSDGRFTGKKEAYGDQFIVCHTPTQLKRAYTSIVLYSATGRVAR